MSRERDKRKGSYFFWDAWRGSEVSGLTYAAKGLWMDLLAVMADRTPQGVIAGDLESLAEALGFVGPMSASWAEHNKRLVEELESKRVFSRGYDVDDDLDPDAIVNRRMYREWCKAEGVSRERRRAARIRWGQASGAETVSTGGYDSIETVASEMASRNAKRCKSDANALQNESVERVGGAAVAGEGGGDGACKTMLIPTQPNPTQPNPTPACAGDLHPVGSVVGSVQPSQGKVVYESIIALTRDRGIRARWWNGVVNAFRKAQQLGLLHEHVELARAKGAALRSPSRYLAKRVLSAARDCGISVPELPGGET